MTIADGLSLLRIALAPVLLALAWSGASHAFTACLALALVTDIADGKIARALGQTSTRGAQLDSAGDLLLYLCVPLAAVWLRPALVRSELVWFGIVLGSAFVPVGVGVARFGRPTSYHTRATKVAAYLLGGAALAVFAADDPRLFRLATIVFVVAQIEEVAITLTLPAWHANVPSLRHARALRREAR